MEAHKQAACSVELAASPERVRELKNVEASRKAALAGSLRRQYRAFEELAFERRAAETQSRQSMHDRVLTARYLGA